MNMFFKLMSNIVILGLILNAKLLIVNDQQQQIDGITKRFK